MQQNNNTSVLPWYTDIKQQDSRKAYSFGEIYPLFAPANMLLPFQVVRETRENSITSFKLFSKDGKLVQDLSGLIMDAGLQICKFESLGYDVIVYPANMPLAINQLDGIYYCEMSDGVQTWWSEMFTAVQDVSGYLKIEWWDINNFVMDDKQIVYRNPKFKNVLYFCADLSRPGYDFEEEGEDRGGYFFAETQVSQKTYKSTILAPEYLCDVMRMIRMADYVKVTDKYGIQYDCDSFLITPTWQEQGNIASVAIEFKTATVAKKMGRGYILSAGGDFNEDYSNDFLNK